MTIVNIYIISVNLDHIPQPKLEQSQVGQWINIIIKSLIQAPYLSDIIDIDNTINEIISANHLIQKFYDKCKKIPGVKMRARDLYGCFMQYSDMSDINIKMFNDIFDNISGQKCENELGNHIRVGIYYPDMPFYMRCKYIITEGEHVRRCHMPRGSGKLCDRCQIINPNFIPIFNRNIRR